MRAGLTSKALSPMSITGPVQMLAVVGAKNSRRVLLAMASKTGAKLRLVWSSYDPKAETFLEFSFGPPE
jgi:hypothetical protein